MSKPKSPEHRAKISEALKGRQFSEETRAKMSASHAGRDYSALHAAGRVVFLGRSHTDETRRKLSAAKTQNIEERFWSKVAIGAPDECWEWQAGRQKLGYGIFGRGSKIDGTHRTELAHRVAWELTHGAIDKGVKIRHFVCDNPPCCNPAHLRPGTQADNIGDMIAKGRKVVRRGLDHPSFKLTDEAKQSIRDRYAAGGISQQQLANDFHVNQATISKVIRGVSR